MADMKASALLIAAPLTGAEFWAAVQSGDDRKVTAEQIAAYAALRCGYVAHQSAVQQSLTGTTAETTLASFTIPADSLGPNGSADFLMLFGITNSANAKTLRLRINGVQVWGMTSTTIASLQIFFSLANRNALNAQVATANATTGFAGTSGLEQTFAFDTSADLSVTITGQLATAGEEIRLARRRCIIFPGA